MIHKEFDNDFIGFTYNDIHSSELGIYHVSGGSRYKENLLPSFQDKTVQVPGRDGIMLFGTDNQSISITLQIAFDNVSEEQLVRMRNIFNDKKVHPLIFDETPYKAYYVKCANPPELSYVCFGENDGKSRIYKGEGTLSFVCYEGFARSTINSTASLIGNIKYSRKIKISNRGYRDDYYIPSFPTGKYPSKLIGHLFTKTLSYDQKYFEDNYQLNNYSTAGELTFPIEDNGYIYFLYHFNEDDSSAFSQLQVYKNNLEHGVINYVVLYYEVIDINSLEVDLAELTLEFDIPENAPEELRIVESSPRERPIQERIYLKDGYLSYRQWINSINFPEQDIKYRTIGDFNSPLKIRTISSLTGITNITFSLEQDGSAPEQFIELDNFTLKPGDYGIELDSELRIIRGIDSDGKYTSNIYNQYIADGDFLYIPRREIDNNIKTFVLNVSNNTQTTTEFEYRFM